MKTYNNEITAKEAENEDIINLWEPLEFNINENYNYVPNNIIFSICSNLLYYVVAYPVIKIITKIIYDLKIEGRENIKNIESGAITVANHVLFLDCAMVGIACGLKKVYYTTREGSFKIPFVRKLIKLLRAIPIPNDVSNKKGFVREVSKLLERKKIVHFYPEAALWPYHTKIRNFKNGAFDIAVQNKVPVIPMVFKFREPKGIRKLLKKKKDVTLTILKPIMPEQIENKKHNVENLKTKVHKEMEDILK